MNILLLLVLAQATTAPALPIDPARVEAEMAADADVLRSLQQNGDNPSISRPVDVRFVGSSKNISDLQKQIPALGWTIVQKVRLDNSEVALDVQRNQTTDPAALRQLTEAALRIEAQYGVHYDGWGTVATQQ